MSGRKIKIEEIFIKSEIPNHDEDQEIALMKWDDSVDTERRFKRLPKDFPIKSLNSETAKKKNQLYRSKRLYQCLSCPHKTNRRSNIKDHLKIHKPPTEVVWFPCHMCSYKSKHRSSLNRHLLMIHKMKSKPEHKNISNQLEPCKTDLKREDPLAIVEGHQEGYTELIIHERNRTYEGATYYCQSCSYTSFKKSNIMNHLLVHKSSAEINWYTCSSCNYRTKYKHSASRHVQKVHKMEFTFDHTHPGYQSDICKILITQEVRKDSESGYRKEPRVGFDTKLNELEEKPSGMITEQSIMLKKEADEENKSCEGDDDGIDFQSDQPDYVNPSELTDTYTNTKDSFISKSRLKES
ncbi:hypothetical protein JTB14_034693 [Gonioctena quinquepunctata]|nr:hypothetical protein JTB14_034693 [Gonioctena quinquepunctata]